MKIKRKFKKNKKLVLVDFIVLCLLSVGYASFQTTLNLNVSGHVVCSAFGVSKLKEKVITSGDGLYVDNYEVGRYVYRGSKPDNYIKLDDDSYRTIGIEKNLDIKIVSSDSARKYNYGDDGAAVTKYWGSNKTMRDIDGNLIMQAPIYTGGCFSGFAG